MKQQTCLIGPPHLPLPADLLVEAAHGAAVLAAGGRGRAPAAEVDVAVVAVQAVLAGVAGRLLGATVARGFLKQLVIVGDLQS